MRTLHIQLLFQSAIESYLVHPVSNNDILTILAQFNLKGLVSMEISDFPYFKTTPCSPKLFLFMGKI